MGLEQADVAILRCPSPECDGGLVFEPLGEQEPAEAIRDGMLHCQACGRTYPVRGGLPQLVDREKVRGSDRMLRPIYDFIAPFHDYGVDYTLPLLQFPDTKGASRQRYIDELELGKLEADPDTRPRILEVGIGSGANLPLVRGALPFTVRAETWGVDLSTGMLAECQERAEGHPGDPPKLLLADAHALPFQSGSFDRVFHVGGINGYGNPAQALAEMARVAKRDTPIVVVDEELDPARRHSLFHRLAFRALTWYDDAPGAPLGCLPQGACGAAVKPVSRFYYCLSFRMPPEGDVPPLPGPPDPGGARPGAAEPA